MALVLNMIKYIRGLESGQGTKRGHGRGQRWLRHQETNETAPVSSRSIATKTRKFKGARPKQVNVDFISRLLWLVIQKLDGSTVQPGLLQGKLQGVRQFGPTPPPSFTAI